MKKEPKFDFSVVEKYKITQYVTKSAKPREFPSSGKSFDFRIYPIDNGYSSLLLLKNTQ